MIINDNDTLQHTPKYFQIYRELMEQIREGQFKPGEVIPPEFELCQIYQVSRGTVRRALSELERQGLITRLPGRPSRVSLPKIPLLSSGFRNDIVNKGHTATLSIIFLGQRPSPGAVTELLNLPNPSDVFVIQRVIAADSIPVVLEFAYIPLPVSPITQEEIETHSLLELIPSKRHMILAKAIESYTPAILTPDEAEQLGVKAGHLAMRDQAIILDINLQPIYVSVALVRGDKAAIVTETVYNVNNAGTWQRDHIAPK